MALPVCRRDPFSTSSWGNIVMYPPGMCRRLAEGDGLGSDAWQVGQSVHPVVTSHVPDGSRSIDRYDRPVRRSRDQRWKTQGFGLFIAAIGEKHGRVEFARWLSEDNTLASPRA